MTKTKNNSAKLSEKLANWLISLKVKKQHGFTLPEVIVAFSVLVMVITTATQILVTVLRVNANNVNSLVAYGLAQEGMEAVRFVRDSDTILGLKFDGTKLAKPEELLWGQKLFDDANTEGVKFFTLDVKNADAVATGCQKAATFSSDCLPIQLKPLDGSGDIELLKKDAKTLIYKKKPSDTPDLGLVYFSSDAVSADPNAYVATQFHRFIRVQALKSGSDIDKLRVSSVVSWISDSVVGDNGVDDNVVGDNNLPMQVMITSELTNWK